MNQLYRALTLILCLMAFNSWGNTPPIEENIFTLCADRTASNTIRCMDDAYANIKYGGYILFKDLENHYKLENGKFQEFLDGTARYTGRWVNIGDSRIKFDVDFHFSGRTSTPPNEPKEHVCLDVNPDGFYYYPQVSGEIIGKDKAAGAKLEAHRFGPSFQVGIGANVTNKDLDFGASGWLAIRLVSQPTTSLNLVLQTSSAGGNGDININLSGDPHECMGSDIGINCPDNITTVAAVGQNGKVVNWNVPMATSTCMVGGNENCPSSNLNGYEYLGKYNGSKYYCSAGDNHTWMQARDLAMAAGGHLAVICSAQENEFLRSGLLASDAWIGYTDHMDEGNFAWVTGDDCSYTNWSSGEPNNGGNYGSDFTRILKNTGKWTDRDKNYKAEFIIEIPCDDNMEPGNVTVEQVEGPAPGSLFPIGTTEVKYVATDECGNMAMCSFTVTVEEPVDPCAGNGSPSVEVDAQDPDCGENNGKIIFNFEDNPNRTGIEFSRDGGQTFPLSVADNAGMAMFGDLGPGTYQIAVRWGNDECLVDLGSLTLEDTRKTPGEQCDDEDATTFNDVISDDGCTCKGTPQGEIRLVCEDDIAVIAEPGANGATVTYNEPDASTTCGLGGLNVDRTEGSASGSLFPIGSTTVKYTVTDACGNMEMCSFEIFVEETPLVFDILCVDDVEVTAEVGEDGAIATFNDPSIMTNCPADGFTVDIAAGLPSGSFFPVGSTIVTFKVTDGCDQTEECSIKVIVNPAPTGDITFVCNDDIEVTAAVGDDGAIVDYATPTASTTCPLDGLEVERTEGPASGSTFPIGMTTVIYTAKDACGGLETCSFKITVNPAPTGDITFDCIDDITVFAAPGEGTAIVNYTTPSAETTCPLGGLSVELLEGLPSGSDFPVGTTIVTYEATDACGGSEMCAFKITVEPTLVEPCINAIEISNKVCDNNGTPSDPSDDTYTFDLVGIAGGSAASSYTGSYDNAYFGAFAFTANYGETITLGPFPAGTFTATNVQPPLVIEGGLDINVSIVDADDPDCKESVVVESTGPCSNEDPKGSIGDFVFFDEDADGIQDDNEIGVGNVTVKLQDADGNTLATTTTENDGAYKFIEVEAGDYKIMVNTPDGLVLSPANQGGDDSKDSDILDNGMTEVFPLAAGEDIDNIDAGIYQPVINDKVKVGDFVFLDNNGNGIQDDNEPGIEGVFIILYDENDAAIAFTISESDGMYMFGDLDPGDYRLKFVGQPDGLIPTTQDIGNDDEKDSDINFIGLTEMFTLVEGFDGSYDAGFKPRDVQPDPARIGNQVFVDANGNGVKDDNEAGFNGVEVKLLDANGAVLQTTNTANNGMYAFSVAAGDYKVMFGTAFGYMAIPQSGNATDGIDNDSDNDPATGMTEVFSVAAGDANATIDAGFKAIDTPCDNVTDAGEIAADEDPDACGPYDADLISSVEAPSGGSGEIEYIWLSSTTECTDQLSDIIAGATSATYDPGVVSQTTYFRRCARRVGCTVWIESNCVIKKVDRCETGDPVDCDAVTATVEEGKVTVDGLFGSNAKVEVLGAGTNWAPELVCGDGGDACSNPQMITDLPEGDYTLKIQLWGADGSYCYTERRITVDGGDPTCDVDGGTISTDDDITDLCVDDNEADLVTFTATGGVGSNSAWVVTKEDGTILNPDAPSTVDFSGAGAGTCKVYYVRWETIEGLEEGKNINDLTGCFDKSNSISVTRRENCSGGEPQCDDAIVTVGNGKINIENLDGQWVVVKIHDTDNGWIITDECFGCENPTTFTVPEGNYMVVIEFYRGVWTDKYCRRDVPVTVGGGNPCTDRDGDGVCEDEDCDDDDATVGAKQPAGTSCNDGNDETVNDVILSDGCTCRGEAPVDKEICAEREVFNTDNCQFAIIYGLYLKLDGYDEYYGVSDANFTEYTDGTALFTATATNNTTPSIGFNIEVEFGARTTLAEVAPKEHNCLSADVNDYYFYETLNGKLTGINDAAGAMMTISRIGPAFQLGIAANITHKFYDFGGSGWFVADLVSQPTSIEPFILNAGAQGQNGDININLSGDGTECIEDRDNSELDCANVAAVATPDGISITGLTAPIEIVKVFDANWVPIDDCTGDCGESMLVSAAPGDYIVRVNFYTANWVGQCEVDIAVNVPASLNRSSSSRNAPQLNVNTFEDNRKVTVEWLTNTGYKNQNYTIEKSIDGKTFTAINELENKDNSDDLAYYKGVDANPALGSNYYRVKQVYVDGSFDYSDVQLVNFNLDLKELAVFPNPAKDEVFVSLKAHAGQKANLQIINTYGQVMKQLEIDEIPNQAIRLDLEDFQNGLYHITIRVDNSNIITKKILVSRLY